MEWRVIMGDNPHSLFGFVTCITFTLGWYKCACCSVYSHVWVPTIEPHLGCQSREFLAACLAAFWDSPNPEPSPSFHPKVAGCPHQRHSSPSSAASLYFSFSFTFSLLSLLLFICLHTSLGQGSLLFFHHFSWALRTKNNQKCSMNGWHQLRTWEYKRPKNHSFIQFTNLSENLLYAKHCARIICLGII